MVKEEIKIQRDSRNNLIKNFTKFLAFKWHIIQKIKIIDKLIKEII